MGYLFATLLGAQLNSEDGKLYVRHFLKKQSHHFPGVYCKVERVIIKNFFLQKS